MAKRKPPSPPDENQSEAGKHLQRISNLLGLLAVKEEPQAGKIVTLSAVGFSPIEIAGLVGTTLNTVSVTLSQQKAAKQKARPKRKTKR